MKKVITMIVMMMLAMSMMIPVCAHAQTYEEAERNNKIIEKLMDIGFVFDNDTGLWIVDMNDLYDWGEKDIITASYNLITNYGTLQYQEYNRENEDADYELTVTYDMSFKWHETEEDFGIIKCEINAYQFIDEINF